MGGRKQPKRKNKQTKVKPQGAHSETPGSRELHSGIGGSPQRGVDVRRRRLRIVKRAVAALAVLAGVALAGAQVYYARRGQAIESARRAKEADKVLIEVSHELLALSRWSPPLPRSTSLRVRQLMDAVRSAEDNGGDSSFGSELLALSEALLLRPSLRTIGSPEPPKVEVPGRKSNAFRFLVAAKTLIAFQNFRQARVVLTAGLERFPEEADFLCHRAMVALRENDLDSASADATRALAQLPSSGFVHYVEGSVLRKRGERRQSRRAFTEAARLEPAWYEPHLVLADISVEEHDYAQAQVSIARVLQSVPDEATSLLAQAALYQQSGRPEEAAAALVRAREALPEGYAGEMGYTGIDVWKSDLPALDELNGDYLVAYARQHKGWVFDGYELPLLRALCATTDLAKFHQFEEALFDTCVEPVYGLGDLDAAAAQSMRLVGRAPACLGRRKVMTVVIEPVIGELRMDPARILRHDIPKIDRTRLDKVMQGDGEDQ